MKYKAEPNLNIIRRTKRQFGNTFVLKNIAQFDENGLFETDDEKLIEILDKSYDCIRLDEYKMADEKILVTEMTDEEIRALAKEKKIKSWNLKKIETLKKELGV